MNEAINTVNKPIAAPEIMPATSAMPAQAFATPEAVAMPSVEPVEEKPYKFRRLMAEDVFPMFKLLSKLGMKEIKNSINSEELGMLVSSFSSENKLTEDEISAIGLSAVLGVADVLLANIPKCEAEIYDILSRTSGLKVDEIKGLGMVTFVEMIFDFVRKEEFGDFIKVVSKLFK